MGLQVLCRGRSRGMFNPPADDSSMVTRFCNTTLHSGQDVHAVSQISSAAMTAAWAVRFDFSNESGSDVSSSLGRLRPLPGVRVLRDGSHSLWVSGPCFDDPLGFLLRSLPCEDRFHVGEGGLLTKFDERTPSGAMPQGDWISIREFVEFERPVAAFRLARIPRVPVTMVRDAVPVKPQFLLVSKDAALAWAESASQVRLDRLSFAVSDDGRLLFRGLPLPSLPGLRLVERELVLVPGGWTWSPAIDARSLRASLEASDGELLFLNLNGEFEKISESEFVAAGRAAIRVSATGIK